MVDEFKQKIKKASCSLKTIDSLDVKQHFIRAKLLQKTVHDALEILGQSESKGCQSLRFKVNEEFKSSIITSTTFGYIQKESEGKGLAKLASEKRKVMSKREVAIKNDIDVFYLSTQVPLHVLFAEDGEMEKMIFLATWKDIPASNEVQYTINNDQHSADTVSQKLRNNNVFTIAKRNVEGQDILYQSLKLTNGIWVLAELKIQPSNSTFVLSLKSRAVDVYEAVRQSYVNILHN